MTRSRTTPPPLAQTNLQLYAQARAADYGKDRILTLRNDYFWVCQLHGAELRGSGKPFLCHVVGAASALIADGAPFPVVRAMLWHAAYDRGRFPTGARGLRPDHQRWLQARIGDEIEHLVRAYSAFSFDTEKARALAGAPCPEDPTDRFVLQMRLANEVDECEGHAGALECRDYWREPEHFDAMINLAERTDMPEAAVRFALARAVCDDFEWLSITGPDVFFVNRPSMLRFAGQVAKEMSRPLRRGR